MAHGLTIPLWWLVCLAVLAGCAARPVYHDRHRPAGETRSESTSPPAEPRRGRPSPTPVQALRPADAHPVDLATVDTSRAYQIGVASYYGEAFHGRPTASGETFNMHRLTAAHRVLPLGTRVRVTSLENGRWVDVKVNDRGPFVEGRVLDLSFAAALELEMVRAGTARVMIELLD